MTLVTEQERRRQLWSDRADEAYRLIGQAKSIVGLYLTAPFGETEEARDAMERVRAELGQAESDLRTAYRAEATVDPAKGG